MGAGNDIENDVWPASQPKLLHRYLTPVYDSARWDRFQPRTGDIIVCTAPKCGTTWTQMLCALLVHRSPELPQPLTRLSRWLDRHTEPVEDVVADFDAQSFRRIIKTHTPLDGLPYFENVSYVVCCRDPRDAFLSMVDHFHNISQKSLVELAKRSDNRLKLPEDANEVFRLWLTRPSEAWTKDGFPFGSHTHFCSTYWAYRILPNIFFLHYADLIADLETEMRRLAEFLAISIPETLWSELVNAARFANMKDNATETAPGAHLGEWASERDFFRKARMGEWRNGLSQENQELYDTLMRERLSPALRVWLEGGRAAAGDPKLI